MLTAYPAIPAINEGTWAPAVLTWIYVGFSNELARNACERMRFPLTLTSSPRMNSSGEAVATGSTYGRYAALLMKMSMGPKAFLVASKAVLTAVWSTMSATKVRTLTPGCWASTSDLVVRREEEGRGGTS